MPRPMPWRPFKGIRETSGLGTPYYWHEDHEGDW